MEHQIEICKSFRVKTYDGKTIETPGRKEAKQVAELARIYELLKDDANLHLSTGDHIPTGPTAGEIAAWVIELAIPIWERENAPRKRKTE